jgi:Type I restriction modification DNA specificity domain
MSLVPLSELFEIRYGHSLELNRLKQVRADAGGVPFVSRKMGDNGIAAYVKLIDGVEPAPGGELSCALSGNGVLSTFVQDRPFYTGFHVACLRPLDKLSAGQLLYYCTAIRANRFRYSYGRQANKTLKNLLLPGLDSVPAWIANAKPDMFDGAAATLNANCPIPLDTESWKAFKYDEIFEIRKGYYNKKPPVSTNESDIPFIGASENRNGVTSYVSVGDLSNYSRDGRVVAGESLDRKLFSGQCITVPNNGASVAEAFYQPRSFACTHDVNPLYLMDKTVVLSPEIGLFLATIIRAEKYRWSYGRKWRPMRMCDSTIRLPVNSNGDPDWNLMIEYIKSLPFSSKIVGDEFSDNIS